MNCIQEKAGVAPPLPRAADNPPLGDYLMEKPALMLTFLDIAERYAHGAGRKEPMARRA